MRISIYVLSFAVLGLTACGMSEEEKAKKIEAAATLRAKQVCEGDPILSPLDNYGQKLNYLQEQLVREGVDGKDDFQKAADLFDEKIKASCPDKFPQ